MPEADSIHLVVVFNHRYDQNIPKLLDLYRGRFERITFLVPAYTGDRPDTVGVLENAGCFQGYFWQALDRLRESRCRHYLLVGDDAILSPHVDARTLPGLLGLDERTGWIKSMTAATAGSFKWLNGTGAIRCVNRDPGIARYRALLPDDAAWEARLARHGISAGRDFTLDNLRANPSAAPVNQARRFRWYRGLLGDAATLLLPPDLVRRLAASRIPVASRLARGSLRRRTLEVPLVTAYSDVVVVPGSALEEFARLCGVFAAMNLFVEVALPTALALSVERIRTEDDTGQRGRELWDASEVAALEAACDRSVARLPRDTFYTHPVKLSRWRVEPPVRSEP